MGLLDKRLAFYPFQFEEAYNFYKRQQRAHWIPEEINLSSDVNDFKLNLTESERKLIGNTLKGFTATETLVQNYWSLSVSKWFKDPQVQMMAATNAAFEGIHQDSYSMLNIELGLSDFEAFNEDPETKAKLDRLVGVPGKSKKEIALSLAVFSAFTEGVSLFSSFAILLNFSRFNKMKGMGQIISYSIRDESLHSDSGCWLFRQFIKENPDLWTDELKKEIYDAARHTVQLEDDFIDKAFELGDVQGLARDDLKQFIRHRANTKLTDLGLKANWKNVDKEAIGRITSWFDIMSSGIEQQDFFAAKPTSYVKARVDWNKMYE